MKEVNNYNNKQKLKIKLTCFNMIINNKKEKDKLI